MACGESPLGYTRVACHGEVKLLWLVGNRRSDTLKSLFSDDVNGCGLWGIAARIHYRLFIATVPARCGLWGIAARIHSMINSINNRLAVACGESPLGYTLSLVVPAPRWAVACGESPLGYTFYSDRPAEGALWLVGNRRSDTLRHEAIMSTLCCGLWGIAARIHFLTWRTVQCNCCGLWGIAARIH